LRRENAKPEKIRGQLAERGGKKRGTVTKTPGEVCKDTVPNYRERGLWGWRPVKRGWFEKEQGHYEYPPVDNKDNLDVLSRNARPQGLEKKSF